MKKQMLLVGWLVLFCGIAGAQPPRPLPEGQGMRKWGEEKREEAIEFLSQYMEPKRLERLRVEEPMAYKHILQHALRQKHELEILKEIDPERYKLRGKEFELEVKSRNLAEDYRTTKSENEKKEIKNELKSVLKELFDLKEKDKKFELKRLEEEIEKLKKIMAERKKHKSDIIEQHLEELLLEKEYMRW